MAQSARVHRCLQRAVAYQLILWLASGASNEVPRSRVLALAPAVSWPWVPAWGSLEPSRRDGENAQKTGKNGEKMGEIWSKKCERGRDGRDHLDARSPSARGRAQLLLISRGAERTVDSAVPPDGFALVVPPAHCRAIVRAPALAAATSISCMLPTAAAAGGGGARG